jgi:hypothetical protein
VKLSKRERNLAIGVGVAGALAALILGWQLGIGGEQSLSDLQAKYADLSMKVDARTKDLDKAKRAAVKLDDWQQRSLPSNVEIGRTLYQNWLHEAVNKAGFRGTKIDEIPTQPRRGMYEELKYNIRGQATLQQFTSFLFDFYQKGHLHKISLLQITPLEKSGDLELVVTVEALALVDAVNHDKLTTEPGNRLLKKTLDEYSKMIVARNVFAPYEPPKPKGGPSIAHDDKPPTPKFDHLEFTKLTGITEIDGKPVAWIETKTTGQSYKAREGEELDIAAAKVKVLHIGLDTRDIELQIGDDKRTIKLGQNLLAKP